MPRGKRPAPFRTRKLSLSGPMVLRGGPRGRVGRRRTFFHQGSLRSGWPLMHVRASTRAGQGRPGRDRAVADRDARPGRGAARPPRRVEPALPDDVTGAELDRAVRAELASLAKLNAEAVSRHLVMAGRLLDEDPETAYTHAVAARDRAGRVAAVREAAGLAAYHTGRYAEALAEL